MLKLICWVLGNYQLLPPPGGGGSSVEVERHLNSVLPPPIYLPLSLTLSLSLPLSHLLETLPKAFPIPQGVGFRV